ncbi:plasmid pRiA4b ORF-3 family protein [Limosilactobacillus reuteri]|jgi:hypothetical protein|uniref:plasmid pRiA4b ORF-3 family protein n=1 Tax=Limosilactobacillus reuteri TaxID=1598 RepID=UPI0021002E43|nr:plasmid pRiA4b ORF-3 family protein [Limosilactobacillus reuteri]
MAQLFYSPDLADRLPHNNTGKISQKPLRRWQLSPVKIDNKTYYLYVEEETGLPVFTDKLGEGKFSQAAINFLNEMPFLVDPQRTWLMQNVFSFNLYRPIPSAENEKLKNYLQTIANHQAEFKESLNDNDDFSSTEDFNDLVYSLLALSGNDQEVLGQFCQLVNEEHPVKVKTPRPGSKYCTIKPQFKDPRIWEDDEGKASADNPATVQAISQNNQQMIDQFIASADGQLVWDDKAARHILDRFLNHFMLKNKICTVTTNLAIPNIFFAGTLDQIDEDLFSATLSSFYNFLSHTGIVSQSAARDVSDYLRTSYDIIYGEPELAAPEDDYQDSLIQQLLDELAPAQADTSANVGNRQLINPQNYDQAYVITAELADFKPLVSRTFVIKGSSTIEELAETVILMFHGDLAHLYDAINEQTEEFYTQSEDFVPGGMTKVKLDLATVSLLNEKDKLTIHYDYGDGWEFKLHVQKIQPVTNEELPHVQKARGYGIIEDIGGVGGLEQYYDDYQKGQIDPDFLDWLGGEPIDLNSVDINELNQLIK